MEMQVYIANLGKYNECELVGAWFTPPIDFERIGLNGEYEEYAIHDYELPFEVGEYTPISEINRLCEMVLELEGTSNSKKFKECGLVVLKNCWKIRTTLSALTIAILWKV